MEQLKIIKTLSELGKEKERARGRKHYHKDIERSRTRRRERVNKWRAANPDKVKASNKQSNQKRKDSLSWKLGYGLRNRMRLAIKNNQKIGSAVSDLGCSVEYFKMYLEAKFEPGMTWDNWSRTGWHIDHIIPLNSFDLTNREEFSKAAHYTNMQPMWAKENCSKSDKYDRAA